MTRQNGCSGLYVEPLAETLLQTVVHSLTDLTSQITAMNLQAQDLRQSLNGQERRTEEIKRVLFGPC